MTRNHDDNEQYDEALRIAFRRFFAELVAEGKSEAVAKKQAQWLAEVEVEELEQSARDHAEDCRISRRMFDHEFA